MKNKIRFRIIYLVLALLVCTSSYQIVNADVNNYSSISLPFRDLSADEITEEMGLGWNLGNTMDGHSAFMPSETAWQSTITTRELVDAVHNAGFNTIRIPVTWGLKIDDQNNYAIDVAWMNRILEIAEYGLHQDMYVIINIHHDGAEQNGWLRVAAEGEDLDIVKAKFARVWEQIAEAFKGYDEHVIFESMNEVKSDDDTKDGVIRDFMVISELNQIFLDTVRKTGGNNTRRWLLVPGRYTNIINTTNEDNGFMIPDDPWNEKNRVMVSVHDYDYSFGLLDTMGITTWSEESAKKMAGNFQLLIDDFTSKDIPVVLGEYGASNKNNTQARAYYYEVMARLSRVSGVVCCLWDNGWYDKSIEPADYSMALFDRETKEIIYPEIVQAILRGYFLADESKGIKDINSIERGTKENPVDTIHVESISLSDESLLLKAGTWKKISAEVLPENTNEVIVYESSDPNVVTVYNGLVRAKGIGRCTVSVYSQGGDVRNEMEVTVFPDETLSSDSESIETDSDIYSLSVSKSQKIDISLLENKEDVISFVSSNPDIVTVGSLGILNGKSVGTAKVILTTRSGKTKLINVNVVPMISSENSLEIAINAYYNDSEHEYYNNCRGESMIMTGNGTYTLTFDCSQHLTDEAIEAGITSLANVGAVYIADVAGNNGLLASCDIFYEKIVVDGDELTITQEEPKTALKTGDRFDTNDPLNAWDGSSVAEATEEDYMITIDGHAEPKIIEVTFTISNFVLAKNIENEKEEKIPSEILVYKNELNIDSTNSIPFEIELLPHNTTDSLCFISNNPSVVWVSSSSVWTDKDGKAQILLIPISTGEATIMCITESGVKEEISVISSSATVEIEGETYNYIGPSETSAPAPVTSPKVTDDTEVSSEPKAVEDENTEGLPVFVFVLLGALGGLVALFIVFMAARVIIKKE